MLAALNGQINGVVRDADTKAPLSGVRVSAVSASAKYSATTDARGAFQILGVIPDTYTLGLIKAGYNSGTLTGVTVLADSAQSVDAVLSKSLKTIGNVSSRSSASAFQPQQTEDSYTVNAKQITQVQGKAFNTDEKSLLQSFPSVTVDKTGTVNIRGGLSFETGYQLEGIDYTEPNKSLQNPFANVGNFNLLNGIGSAQLIPGGGDASHGNTGTGLVSLRSKRGTYPGFGSIDAESSMVPFYHQGAIEYGIASPNGRISNYLSFTHVDRQFQYGAHGIPGASIGIFQGADQANVYNPASSQRSNDFLDNFFFKFGKGMREQIQVFYQRQAVRQGLSYNGIGNVCYASCAGFQGGAPPFIVDSGPPPIQHMLTDATPSIAPLFPDQTNFTQLVTSEDAIQSPFQALKVEYSTSLSATKFLTVRAYKTLNEQKQYQPSIGIYVPENGGIRTGTSGELSAALGEHNVLELGGKYEFVKPFGSLEDTIDYAKAFYDNADYINGLSAAPVAGGAGFTTSIPAAFPALDFVPASQCPQGGAYNAGDTQYAVLPGFAAAGSNGFVPCGYLSKYFSRGIPRLPAEIDKPVASQQVYGYFLQDTLTHKRLKAQLGLRLDGYNFQFPDDPLNPPTIAAVRHQRLFEPHVGITYKLGTRDYLRATYGRTLSIPLVGLFGNNIDRSSLAAFAGIPSYDNSTGTAAAYCGVNLKTLCRDYADQLYWLLRDAKFGGNQTSAPLRGATFTNYDFTFSHLFRNGFALSVTPFFRRGYDLVETSYTVTGANSATGLPILGAALQSNAGIQKATGVELLLTKEADVGLSGQFSATYVNQLGNDPPGTFLPTASLLLGNLYRSSSFSPFQAVLALTYKKPWFRMNSVTTYLRGYPYGQGTVAQVFINGVPYNVPNSNIAFLVDPHGQNLPSTTYVDPQNPGSRLDPTIIGNNGLAGGSAAGSLISSPTVNENVVFELTPPATRFTYGLSITNLFNALSSAPVLNYRYVYPVATGVAGPGTGSRPPNFNPQTDHSPALYAGTSYSPYLILPNRQPLEIRTYVQIKI